MKQSKLQFPNNCLTFILCSAEIDGFNKPLKFINGIGNDENKGVSKE